MERTTRSRIVVGILWLAPVAVMGFMTDGVAFISGVMTFPLWWLADDHARGYCPTTQTTESESRE